MIEAIIFDMDGVIVDTEIHHFNTLKRFLAQENRLVKDQDLFPVVGSSGDHFYSLLAYYLGTGTTIEEAFERYHAYENAQDGIDYRSIFRKEMIHILEYGKENNLKLGLASSSTFPVIQEVITTCDIVDYFDLVVSGQMFPESKPNPAIYLHTANELKVPPKKCLAVEDSFYGIQAAKSAGMTVIGYKETRFSVDQSKADYLGKDMVEIYQKIRQLHQNI